MKFLLKICSILIIPLILVPLNGNAEDYQYQYFTKEKDKYVPFSDYIPKVRMHYKVVPHYVEDYYLLYGLKQYYNENTLRKNIDMLKTALNSKFRHPSEALIKIETEEEYQKYRRLMFMHINLLIMRSYMRIASRYDKQKIYFYNAEFSKEINESLNSADKLYNEAIPYWEKAKDYAEKASDIKLTTDLGFIETERYTIVRGDLDFGNIIDKHLESTKEKRENLQKSLLSAKR
jgi:hypothetical protein